LACSNHEAAARVNLRALVDDHYHLVDQIVKTTVTIRYTLRIKHFDTQFEITMSVLVEQATRDPGTSEEVASKKAKKRHSARLSAWTLPNLHRSHFAVVVIRLILVLIGVLTIIYIEPLVMCINLSTLTAAYALPDMLALMWANFEAAFI